MFDIKDVNLIGSIINSSIDPKRSDCLDLIPDAIREQGREDIAEVLEEIISNMKRPNSIQMAEYLEVIEDIVSMKFAYSEHIIDYIKKEGLDKQDFSIVDDDKNERVCPNILALQYKFLTSKHFEQSEIRDSILRQINLNMDSIPVEIALDMAKEYSKLN